MVSFHVYGTKGMDVLTMDEARMKGKLKIRWMVLAVGLALVSGTAWASGTLSSSPGNIYQLNFVNNFLQKNLLDCLHIILAIVCIFAPLLVTRMSIHKQDSHRSGPAKSKNMYHGYYGLSMTLGFSMTLPLYVSSWYLSPTWYIAMEMFWMVFAVSLGAIIKPSKR